MDQILRLLQSIMPFVTEEILDKSQKDRDCRIPTGSSQSLKTMKQQPGVEALKDVIRSVRNSRAEVNVAPQNQSLS